MNITLALDEKVVERAREVARGMGKSLNQLVREHLESLVAPASAEAEIAELRALSSEARGNRRGGRFRRDDLHERS